MRATSPDLVGKKVWTPLWGYVPSFDGEDVDKDSFGDVMGTVESITQNPDIVRIKVEKFRPNILNAPWQDDLSQAEGGYIGSPCHYENGYLEEWYYNLELVD